MKPVVIGGAGLDVAQLVAVAGGARVALSPEAREAMARGHAAWWQHGPIDILKRKEAWLVGPDLPEASAEERLAGFVRTHCAGVGEPLAPAEVRALMLARANALACGLSGVRPEAVELLLAMLNADVVPRVPGKGSVGAAGDLSPLAHVALVAFRLGGRAWREGRLLPAAEAMQGLPALTPEPKEALALINGASLTVALGAFAVHRAERLLHAAEEALAMSMAVMLADADCLDAGALAARGHAGAMGVAARVRARVAGSRLVHSGRSADAFSVRCAPAVLGAAHEALAYVRGVVETELGGACDNPLLIGDRVIEAGNFHGAPVALALDHLKVALTQVASIAERRIYRMTYGKLTGNLPSFLVESTGVNSGFMLAQYTAASLVSECKGLSHPASVDSIPTGQHHEDHVPMGPTAARTLLAVVEAVAEVLSIELLVAAQGLDMRREGLHFTPDGQRVQGEAVPLAPGVAAPWSAVRALVPRWHEDRVLHRDIAKVSAALRAGSFGPPTEASW